MSKKPSDLSLGVRRPPSRKQDEAGDEGDFMEELADELIASAKEGDREGVAEVLRALKEA